MFWDAAIAGESFPNLLPVRGPMFQPIPELREALFIGDFAQEHGGIGFTAEVNRNGVTVPMRVWP